MKRKFNEEFAQEKFKEMKKLEFEIQGMASIFQNAVTIDEIDITMFDIMKDRLIRKINSISLEMKNKNNLHIIKGDK